MFAVVAKFVIKSGLLGNRAVNLIDLEHSTQYEIAYFSFVKFSNLWC